MLASLRPDAARDVARADAAPCDVSHRGGDDLELAQRDRGQGRAEEYASQAPDHGTSSWLGRLPHLTRLAGWAVPLLQPGGGCWRSRVTAAAKSWPRPADAGPTGMWSRREVHHGGEGGNVTHVVRVYPGRHHARPVHPSRPRRIDDRGADRSPVSTDCGGRRCFT